MRVNAGVSLILNFETTIRFTLIPNPSPWEGEGNLLFIDYFCNG
jgi:hypothetical protein